MPQRDRPFFDFSDEGVVLYLERTREYAAQDPGWKPGAQLVTLAEAEVERREKAKETVDG